MEKANFKQLNKLYLSKNKISDISVLEKVNFKKLKELDLSDNKISDISVLEKVYFNEINKLYLYINNINKNENASLIKNLQSKINGLFI